MKDKLTMNVGFDIDMQQFYDGLVLYRKSIDAQIKALGEDASVCTHLKTIEVADGVKICANKFCNKAMDSGIHDWVK